MRKRRNAVALLLLTAVLWSTGGVLIKWIDWHPLAIASVRSLIAAALLIAVRGWPRFSWSGVQIGGALAYAGSVCGFVAATKLTTAANAILLVYTAPIYVALLSAWFLQEKVTRRDWLIVALVMGGMGLFFLDQLTMAGWWGNVCAMAGGVAMAWLVLCLCRQKEAASLNTVLLGNLLTAVIGLPFVFGTLPPLSSWLALVFAGTVQIALAFLLYTWAIKTVSALDAVLIPVIEPLLNPLWVLLVLGERPGPWAILGGAVVVGAITVRALMTVPPESVAPSALPTEVF
jgi:drug/metabolite transporter (DMT)-like permease